MLEFILYFFGMIFVYYFFMAIIFQDRVKLIITDFRHFFNRGIKIAEFKYKPTLLEQIIKKGSIIGIFFMLLLIFTNNASFIFPAAFFIVLLTILWFFYRKEGKFVLYQAGFTLRSNFYSYELVDDVKKLHDHFRIYIKYTGLRIRFINFNYFVEVPLGNKEYVAFLKAYKDRKK